MDNEAQPQLADSLYLTSLLLLSKAQEAAKTEQIQDSKGKAFAYQEVKDVSGKGAGLYAARLRMPDGEVRNYQQTENIELYNGTNINCFERRDNSGKAKPAKDGGLEIVLGFPGNDMSISDLKMSDQVVWGQNLTRYHDSTREQLPSIVGRMVDHAKAIGAKNVDISILSNSIGAINSVVALDWLRDYQRKHENDPVKINIVGDFNAECVGAGQALQDVAMRRASVDNNTKTPTKTQIAEAARWIVGENTYSMRAKNTIFQANGADDVYDNAGIGHNFEITTLVPEKLSDLMTHHKISFGPNELLKRGMETLSPRPDHDIDAGLIALGSRPLTETEKLVARGKTEIFVAIGDLAFGIPKALERKDRPLWDLFNKQATFTVHGNPEFDFPALKLPGVTDAPKTPSPSTPTPAQQSMVPAQKISQNRVSAPIM